MMYLSNECIWTIRPRLYYVDVALNCTTHAIGWYAWHPVKLKTGKWVWLRKVWRSRWAIPPYGIIEYWED